MKDKIDIEISSKYKSLQEIIISWMNDPSDHDINEWPKIEKDLKENKICLK